MRIDASAQDALLRYDWPGNVRELEHLLSRSVLKALGRHTLRPRILSLEAIDLDLREKVAASSEREKDRSPEPTVSHVRIEGSTLRQAVQNFEQALVRDTLAAHGFNGAAAARALGVDRGNLARLAKRMGLSLRGHENLKVGSASISEPSEKTRR